MVLLGGSNTGKTSLVLRFVEGSYRDHRSATVGAFFLTKRLTLESMTCKLLLWDTAGQEQFQRLAVTYYKQAAAAIVCVDLSGDVHEQLSRLQGWLDEVLHNTPNQRIVIVVAGCKCDLAATVGLEEGVKEVAHRVGATYFRTSAKNDVNVTEVFRHAAMSVLQCQQEAASGRGRPIAVTLGGSSLRNPTNRTSSPGLRYNADKLSASATTNGGLHNKHSIPSTPQTDRDYESKHDPYLEGDSSDPALQKDDDLNASHTPKIMCDNGLLICASSGGTTSDCIIL